MGFFSKKKETEVVTPNPSSASTKGGDEVNAAIALALYLYKSQLHDQENAVLTINRVSRVYSPWSSKIYSMRRHPRGY